MVEMPTLHNVYQAYDRIKAMILKTPLMESPALAEKVSVQQIRLKLECLQNTGSFKIRGAANKILSLSKVEKQKGVIAFSTGNHGKGVAHVARLMGIRSVICLSTRVPKYRVEALQALGAEVIQHGDSQDEAFEYTIKLQKKEGLTMINPFDDPLVIAGQGTIGLEILEDAPDTDTVLVPLSGGGLISGVALALKTANPDIRVIGVSMAVGPAMYHSIQSGRPVEIEEKPSLADALLGGIGMDNQYTFPMVRDGVDDIILVSEKDIADAMCYLLHTHHLVVEGSGAVGVAALIGEKNFETGNRIAVVLSGGNADVGMLVNMAAEYQPSP